MYRFVLTHNSNSYDIPANEEPLGWEECAFTLARDNDWHGFFVDYSIDLKFICGSKDFIWQAWQDDGYNALVAIDIYRWSGDSECADVPNVWVLEYEGKINILSIALDYSTNTLTANIEPTGAAMQLLNARDTAVDLFTTTDTEGSAITVPATAPFALTIDGRPLLFRANYSEESGATYSIGTVYQGLRSILQIVTTLDYSDIPGTATYPQLHYTTLDGNNYPFTQWQPFLVVQNLGDYEICAKIRIHIKINYENIAYDNIEYAARFGYVKYNGVLADVATIPAEFVELQNYIIDIFESQEVLCGADPPTLDYNFVVDFNQVFTDVEPGTLFYFGILQALEDVPLGGSATCYRLEYTDDSYISVRYISEFEATETKAFYADDAFTIVARAITGNTVDTTTDALTRTMGDIRAFTAIASGLSLRGFSESATPGSSPSCWGGDDNSVVVKRAKCAVSLTQLFTQLNAILHIGMGIEYSGSIPYLRVEGREYFYNTNNVVLTIANLQKFEAKYKRSIDQSRIFKNLKIGYSKYLDDTSLNGQDEINTYREYTTNAKEANANVDVVSEFIASEYLIEQTRRVGSAIDSGNYDDDVFVFALDTEDETVLEYKVDTATAVNLLLPANKFNYRFSPYYLARNSYGYLGMPLYYTNGIGNVLAEFKTIGEAAVHGESNNLINISSIYIGKEIVEFEYPINWQQYNAIKADPYSLIYLADDDEYFFIISIEFKPNNHSRFKLLKYNNN